MPLPKHAHPTSRVSVAGAVLGILLIASAVVVTVPLAMYWPASWPGAPVPFILLGVGGALIARHKSRHRGP
jgi:hypothetical protein